MPKKRVIACLVVKDRVVVQSLGFRTYLPVGRPEVAARFLDHWGVDEIILLDIAASAEGRLIDPALVRRVSQACFVPVAAGGGIRSVDDVRTLLQSGADKVSINRLAIEDIDGVREAVRVFGSQCVIASIDARRDEDGQHRVYGMSGRRPTAFRPASLARRLEEAGVGEILLNSIDRDGSKKGYDLALIDDVAAAVNIPVIAIGGAGHPIHLVDALRRDTVSAAAAANFFHFSEHSVALTKSYLRHKGIDIRLDSPANYEEFEFCDDGRIAKREDSYLEDLVFKYIPEETI